jgi:type IV secretory pathway TrbD component
MLSGGDASAADINGPSERGAERPEVRQWDIPNRRERGKKMIILLALLVVLAPVGIGFAVHLLWIAAFIFAVIWLVGYALGRGESAGRQLLQVVSNHYRGQSCRQHCSPLSFFLVAGQGRGFQLKMPGYQYSYSESSKPSCL